MPKHLAGPVGVNTQFEQVLDFKGKATPCVWKVKTLEAPQSVVLKGKMKVDMHAWYWPAKIKGERCSSALQQRRDAMPRHSDDADADFGCAALHGAAVKVTDKYYVQDGPSENTSVVRAAPSLLQLRRCIAASLHHTASPH